MTNFDFEAYNYSRNAYIEYCRGLPWYKKDRLGWEIETFEGKPLHSFMRIICQNIRKVTG